MTKILSMFFTGLTLLSFSHFANANCFTDLTSNYTREDQNYREAEFGEVLLQGSDKQVTESKVKGSRLPVSFIKEFCSSQLQTRADELKECLSDAFDAGLGSEAQPKSQKICVGVLAKYPSYDFFSKCYDYAKSKIPDSYDAFEACL